jgi:hypothetical protein
MGEDLESEIITPPSKIYEKLPTTRNGLIMNEIKEDINESSLKTDT